MKTAQLFFVIAGLSLISWSSAQAAESRQYLPPAAPVVQRKLYKPSYNHYQPQYLSSYCPLYSNGGYQQQTLGQHITTGSALGGYQPQALGQQITSGASLGGYQKPALNTQISSGTSLDLSGLGLINYYPNLNLDLVASLKPNGNVLETVSDPITGNYVYGKKK